MLLSDFSSVVDDQMLGRSLPQKNLSKCNQKQRNEVTMLG